MQVEFEGVLLALFFIVIVIKLFTLLFIYTRIPLRKNDCAKVDYLKPVSVIISAKNEEQNLQKHLVEILEQNYPEYEVVVVNDRSYDETEELLKGFKKQYGEKLQVVSLGEDVREFPGKKLALTLGIKKAKYDQLLFTDADCVPVSDNWITKMQRNFDDDKEIVIGFSPYKTENSFLNLIIQWETFQTALNYISFALSGMPYMGVGRNMAYRKTLFLRNKGFASHLNIPSGDDDLFVNNNALNGNVAIEICPESFIESKPKQTFTSWIRQKKRHLQAGKFYKKRHRSILGGIWLVNLLFYVLFIFYSIFFGFNFLSVGTFISVLVIQWIIYGISLSRLKLGYLIPAVAGVDFLYQVVVYPLIGFYASASKNKNVW
jgi:poly-beta-1,6-N-acetyl-D-glucosamine synthase